MKNLLIALLITGMLFPVLLLAPVKKEVKDGDLIELGQIGPGQTITFYIEPKVTEGGIYNQGGRYDFAKVTSIMPGWRYENSKQLGYPLQVKITAAKDANEGEYYSNVTIIDENYGEKLENITLVTKVNVVYNIMDVTIEPEHQIVRPKDKAIMKIRIYNKGTTGDVFKVWSEGSERWQFYKEIYVAPGSTETLDYVISEEEEEKDTMVIKVESLASNIIKDEKTITVVIRSDLIADYKSVNNGLLIFSVFEGIIFSITGLISNIF